MKSRTISKREWQSFFRDFSRIHAGALITMHVTGPDVGSNHEKAAQPLRGISEDGNEIFIHIGDGNRRPHVEHRVQHVKAIRLQQTDEGADAAVNITSIDGTRTSVRFRSPALPEMLDPAAE
jgi:hypothetical protein